MSEGVILWLVGPQLLGVVFLLVGFIQKTWPPKKINSLYGYRTATSMKNQEIWDEANRYSAIYMMKCGVVCLACGVLVALLTHFVPMTKDGKGLTMLFSILTATFGSVLSMMVKTENHLAKKFDSEGNNIIR